MILFVLIIGNKEKSISASFCYFKPQVANALSLHLHMQTMKQRIQNLSQNASTTITSVVFLSGWKEVMPVLYVIRFAFETSDIFIYQINILSWQGVCCTG